MPCRSLQSFVPVTHSCHSFLWLVFPWTLTSHSLIYHTLHSNMRFSTLSLFAVYSLFANAFAVPTTVQRRGVTVSQVEERNVPKICTIVSGLLEEVKGCTHSISASLTKIFLLWVTNCRNQMSPFLLAKVSRSLRLWRPRLLPLSREVAIRWFLLSPRPASRLQSLNLLSWLKKT